MTKREVSKVMRILGKESHKKSPRSKEYFSRIGKIGRASQLKKLSPVKPKEGMLTDGRTVR